MSSAVTMLNSKASKKPMPVRKLKRETDRLAKQSELAKRQIDQVLQTADGVIEAIEKSADLNKNSR